jgi:hypothetical protein
MKPSPLQEDNLDPSSFPALGEAYAKAFSMLPDNRKKVWVDKLAGRVRNRSKTRPLARDEIRGNTNRNPLARPTA